MLQEGLKPPDLRQGFKQCDVPTDKDKDTFYDNVVKVFRKKSQTL